MNHPGETPNPLPHAALLEVVKMTPLVSIDLIVRNQRGEVLLGLRKNEPARGWWFVPGGRIYKGESLQEAFSRIAREELGVTSSFDEARPLGVFEHRYTTNFASEAGIATQYFVLGYEITDTAVPNVRDLPDSQHREWKWFSLDTLLAATDVHENTKLFFVRPGTLDERQYEIVVARRQAYDALLWQTPVLSLTALAFLLTIALAPETTLWGRRFASTLALVAAVASVQLMWKHRFMEVRDSRLLKAFEEARRGDGFLRIHGRPERQWGWRSLQTVIIQVVPSFWLWFVLLLAFAAAPIFVLIYPEWFANPTSP